MTKNELIKNHEELFNRIPSSRYVELFFKFVDYSNCEFPITDFLLDIELNKEPSYNKERAFNDLEKIFNLFKYYYEASEAHANEQSGIITSMTCREEELKNIIRELEKQLADTQEQNYKRMIGQGVVLTIYNNKINELEVELAKQKNKK